MSFFLYLNSRDSSHPSPNYNLYFPINDTSLANVARFQMTLHSVEFVNSVYPINEFNNLLHWVESPATARTATIPPGNYTGSSLAAQLKVVMDIASPSDFTVSYNSDSKVYTITWAGVGGWYPVYQAFSLWPNLAISTSVASLEASKVSYAPIMISGTNIVDVVTSINTKSISSTTTSSILARIPIAVAFSEIVYYEPANPNTITMELPSLKELYLSLYDDRGMPYKLPENAVFSIAFKITPL